TTRSRRSCSTARKRSAAELRLESNRSCGIFLAFHLVRFEMERVATGAGVEPTRISFVAALRLVCDEWLWCALASPGRHPEAPAEPPCLARDAAPSATPLRAPVPEGREDQDGQRRAQAPQGIEMIRRSADPTGVGARVSLCARFARRRPGE